MAKQRQPMREQAQELQARLQQYRQWWMFWLAARQKDLEADLRATGQLAGPSGEEVQDGVDAL